MIEVEYVQVEKDWLMNLLYAVDEIAEVALAESTGTSDLLAAMEQLGQSLKRGPEAIVA